MGAVKVQKQGMRGVRICTTLTYEKPTPVLFHLLQAVPHLVEMDPTCFIEGGRDKVNQRIGLDHPSLSNQPKEILNRCGVSFSEDFSLLDWLQLFVFESHEKTSP